MELRHLRYFVAIAEEGSFTRAGERLWVAQPGLSAQIRQLETELKTQLFERHARGVNLTDAGELLLGRARAALAAADHARATGSDIQAGLVGTLRIGIATGARWPLESSLLDAFGRERPQVEITVVESHGGTLLRDVLEGRLDVLLSPSTFASSRLQRLRLGCAPWGVLVGPGHRLARPGAVGAHDLRDEHVVVTGHRDGAGYDRAVTETLLDLGVTPVLERGGPGNSLFAAVSEGTAVALTTMTGRVPGELIVRPLDPSRHLHFELLCRDETPAPALRELCRIATARVEPAGSTIRPALAAVA